MMDHVKFQNFNTKKKDTSVEQLTVCTLLEVAMETLTLGGLNLKDHSLIQIRI